MRVYQKGVTLIELLTVIAVVGILGTIALTSYRNNVVRGNRVDATAALLRLAATQEKLYVTNNSYANTAALAALGLTTTDRGYYTITVGPDALTGLMTTGFFATATPVAGGPQATDAMCTTLTIDHNLLRGSTGTAPINDCWK